MMAALAPAVSRWAARCLGHSAAGGRRLLHHLTWPCQPLCLQACTLFARLLALKDVHRRLQVPDVQLQFDADLMQCAGGHVAGGLCSSSTRLCGPLLTQTDHGLRRQSTPAAAGGGRIMAISALSAASAVRSASAAAAPDALAGSARSARALRIGIRTPSSCVLSCAVRAACASRGLALATAVCEPLQRHGAAACMS